MTRPTEYMNKTGLLREQLPAPSQGDEAVRALVHSIGRHPPRLCSCFLQLA
jgi:hypothetical protein